MLRDFFFGLTDEQSENFCRLVGTSEDTIRVKYLSGNPKLRKKPGGDRFEKLLSAANQIKPGSITREGLAAYFYAAPARTGQEEAKAA